MADGREQDARENWWVIHSDDLLSMLRRAHAGEDPDLLLVEDYANATHEPITGDTE